MVIFVVRAWKPLGLRGLAAILLSAVALLWPTITLAGLVLVFGAYALIDGALAITAATQQRTRDHVWTLFFEGLLGIGVGLAAFLWTGATALVLVRVIALWAILTGILELVLAIALRRDIPGQFLLGMAGCTSMLLGVLMFAWPAATAFDIVVLLGGYALFFGACLLALAFRLRRLALAIDETTDATSPAH